MECKYCKREINDKATVCHHCQKDQRWWVAIGHYFVTSITVILAIIAGYQIYINKEQTQELKAQTSISYLQMQESKQKRVEAEEVLKKANLVFSNASAISNTANEKSMQVLERSKTVLKIASKNAELAKAVTRKAEREMQNTVARVNESEKGLAEKFDKENGIWH